MPIKRAPRITILILMLGFVGAFTASQAAAQGTAKGYIFWNAVDFQVDGSTICQNLTISFDGSVVITHFSAGPYTGCAYTASGVPEGVNLKLRIHFKPGALNPSGYAEESSPLDPGGDLILPGPPCNKTQPPSPSPSDLTGPMWVCGDNIFNFNVQLYVPGKTSSLGMHPLATTSSLLKAPSPGPVSGSAVAAGSQRTLLGHSGSAPSQGMLLPARPSGAATSSGMLVPAVQSSAQPMSAPGNVGNSAQSLTRTVGAQSEPTVAGSVTTQNGGLAGAAASPPSKGSGITKYDAVTVERGSAQAPSFTNWANSKTSGQQAPASAYGSASYVTRLTTANGIVSGYVFWDRQRVAYNPSVSCQGLSVKLTAVGSAGLQMLGTTSQFSWSTNPGGTVGLCEYNFSRVPEGVALMAEVTLSPSYMVQVAVNGPFPLGPTEVLFKVSSQPCGPQQDGGSPSATYLESGWFTCLNKTSNVNFELLPRQLQIKTLSTPHGDGAK